MQLSLDGARDLSVNAIAQRAGVSRSTFYLQFADVDSLALSMLVDVFRAVGQDDLSARRTPGVDIHALAESSFVRLGEHMESRRVFYRASLEWKLTSRVREELVDAYAEHVLATIDADPGILPPGLDRVDASRFVAGGVLAILAAWLRDEDTTVSAEPRRLAARLVALMPVWLTGPLPVPSPRSGEDHAPSGAPTSE